MIVEKDDWNDFLLMSVEDRKALATAEIRKEFPDLEFDDVTVEMSIVNGLSFHVRPYLNGELLVKNATVLRIHRMRLV